MIKSDEGRVEIKGTKAELFADTCVLLKNFREEGIFGVKDFKEMVALSLLGASDFEVLDKLINKVVNEDV